MLHQTFLGVDTIIYHVTSLWCDVVMMRRRSDVTSYMMRRCNDATSLWCDVIVMWRRIDATSLWCDVIVMRHLCFLVSEVFAESSAVRETPLQPKPTTDPRRTCSPARYYIHSLLFLCVNLTDYNIAYHDIRQRGFTGSDPKINYTYTVIKPPNV